MVGTMYLLDCRRVWNLNTQITRHEFPWTEPTNQVQATQIKIRTFAESSTFSRYIINGSTYTFAQTIVMVSGTITSTSTNTEQISPTTLNGVTSVVTLTPISLTGLLDYTEGYCVTPLLTTTSLSSTGGSSGLTMSGFPILAIILGLLVGSSIVLIKRRKIGSEKV